jgi:hypothetical protein
MAARKNERRKKGNFMAKKTGRNEGAEHDGAATTEHATTRARARCADTLQAGTPLNQEAAVRLVQSSTTSRDDPGGSQRTQGRIRRREPHEPLVFREREASHASRRFSDRRTLFERGNRDWGRGANGTVIARRSAFFLTTAGVIATAASFRRNRATFMHRQHQREGAGEQENESAAAAEHGAKMAIHPRGANDYSPGCG